MHQCHLEVAYYDQITLSDIALFRLTPYRRLDHVDFGVQYAFRASKVDQLMSTFHVALVYTLDVHTP